MWGMRKKPKGWSAAQLNAMHWLQHSTLKAARAWRLKMALREVYAAALEHNDGGSAGLAELGAALAPAPLAQTLTEHLGGSCGAW
jgi:transposase